jgi:hypothetical protein
MVCVHAGTLMTILLQTFEQWIESGRRRAERESQYTKTPWEAFMEIPWRPDHLRYERLTENRLFKPRDNLTRL